MKILFLLIFSCNKISNYTESFKGKQELNSDKTEQDIIKKQELTSTDWKIADIIRCFEEKNKKMLIANLKENRPDKDPELNKLVHLAAQRNQANFLRVLLAAGYDIDYRDTFDNTPLIRALYTGSNNAAKLLIEKGADITVKNKRGDSAIKIAYETNNQEILDQLIKAL